MLGGQRTPTKNGNSKTLVNPIASDAIDDGGSVVPDLLRSDARHPSRLVDAVRLMYVSNPNSSPLSHPCCHAAQ
jgi:hypothetical protein